MFLYRFLALFEERKSWGAMPKLTFSFSHTDPRKTHFFEKIRKHGSGLVRKWAQNRPSKKWVPGRIFEFRQKIRVFEHFLGPKSRKNRQKFFDRFFRKVDPNTTLGRLFEKIGPKIFFEIFNFPGSKSAQKDDPFGPTQKFWAEPTFFSKSQKVRFLDFLKFF